MFPEYSNPAIIPSITESYNIMFISSLGLTNPESLIGLECLINVIKGKIKTVNTK